MKAKPWREKEDKKSGLNYTNSHSTTNLVIIRIEGFPRRDEAGRSIASNHTDRSHIRRIPHKVLIKEILIGAESIARIQINIVTFIRS